jgi:hypothetical protein
MLPRLSNSRKGEGTEKKGSTEKLGGTEIHGGKRVQKKIRGMRYTEKKRVP